MQGVATINPTQLEGPFTRSPYVSLLDFFLFWLFEAHVAAESTLQNRTCQSRQTLSTSLRVIATLLNKYLHIYIDIYGQ